MEIQPRYLQAIQAIAGTTPGEKYKTLNIIARQIAQAENSDGHSMNAESRIRDIPELLMPLIRVEVSKILHRYEGIIEGLKSEDITVVNRALKASWFFDGSDSSLANAQFFLNNVFPAVSLYARFRIVKQLGIHLKNTTIAVELFLALVEQYGINQALPLLVACDEGFVSKIFIEDKLVLSMRMARAIYRRYPHLIIKYLMNKPVDGDIIVSHWRNILVDIAISHFKDFIVICDTYGCTFNIHLNSIETKTFLETHKDLLVEKPGMYLELISLESVTQNLSVKEFEKMFKNLFPSDQTAFDYSQVNEHLKYYKPERDKIFLIMKTFREVYGKDFLSCEDLIDPEVMEELPEAERVHQARLKLAEDMSWDHEEYIEEPEKSWRCYLPTSESIPSMIKQMSSSSDVGIRGSLLSQLACTCKINDDKDALLQVLIYGYGYRNDQQFVVCHFLSKVLEYFDLELLSAAHWEILDKHIKFLEMKYDTLGGENQETFQRLVRVALYYRFLNDLPLEDYETIFLNASSPGYNFHSNTSKRYPDLNKKLFDLFMEALPKRYPSQCENSAIISSLLYALPDIIQSGKSSNGKFEKLSIKDYPWLLENVKNFVRSFMKGNYYHTLPQILGLVKKIEPDLYYVFLNDVDRFWDLNTALFHDVLKRTPQRVLDNWEMCLEKVQSNFKWARRGKWDSSKFFIKKCWWYQDLPIKFFNHALAKYKDPKEFGTSLLTLTLLSDGETCTEIIESLMSCSEQKIDDHHLKAVTITDISLLTCASNLRVVNPPVSLETIEKLLHDEYLKNAMQSLTSVSHRIPVPKIMQFAEELAHRQSMTMPYAIRLMDLVAPSEHIYAFLTDLWNKESDTSAGLVVVNRIHSLFCKHPNPRSWRMIRTCIDSLNINFEDKILRRLMRTSRIPKEYRDEYVEYILNLVKSMEYKSEGNPKSHINELNKLSKVLEEPISQILPEEYIQNLIGKYLFDLNYDEDIFEAVTEFTINYILESESYNELRVQFFGNYFRDSITQYWNKPHKKFAEFYPMHVMVYNFFAKISSRTTQRHDVRIFESLLEIFQSVLRPAEDCLSYLELCYSIEFHNSLTSVDFGTRMAEKIPELIEILSPECVVFMTDRLTNFLKSRTFRNVETSGEQLMSIIEVLANSRETYCGFTAAKILQDNDLKVSNERMETVVHTLRNFHHPGISYALNERAATFELP